MKMRMFAVLDKAVQAFNAPFCVRTEGEAKRAFANEVANAQGQIGRHRADYSLYYIGVYDDALGQCTAEPPVVVAEASTVLNEMES